LLRLKRIELQGFKSFPDRVDLRFTGAGIAAIVGPNGCGKSNLADAVNWVLGEQSARTLRGARMEDVIFAGTRDRKPLGLAQVTLTLMDPSLDIAQVADPGKPDGAGKVNGSGLRSLPQGLKPGEFTVTRRLFRSGESEYLVNGRPARLRDIQDIFLGTGLGPECYAIIEQGRIGQILSSRPQDRRAVIEEAAGVSKFKLRRRLAEARLESAKHNLERVFDILEEVGRQAGSLKRQAAKARRYQELAKELTAQLRRVLAGRFQMLERETAKTALDLNLASASLQALAANTAEQEQEYSRCQAEGYQTETRLTEARERHAGLNLESERARGRLEYQQQQIDATEQRLAQGGAELAELDGRSTALQQELEAQRQAVAELDIESQAARERLEAQGRRREELRQQETAKEQFLDSSRQLLLRLLGEASELSNQAAHLEQYLAGLQRDVARAQKEDRSAAADIQWLEAARAELSARLAARQLELESASAQRTRLEQDLSERRAALAQTRRQLEELRTEFSRMKARRDSLEEILSHRAYTTESVKRLFTAIERGEAAGLKPAGVLADFVDVEPAWEKAVEEFLHEELEYIVVENWEQAEAGLGLVRAGVDGRATFLVHPNGGGGNGRYALPEPGEGAGLAGRLGDVLRLTNGLGSQAIECVPRLARCYLADDRAAAQRLAGEYPHLYFLLEDGVCYHGRTVSGGKKSSSGPLALKRELRELKARAQARQKQLDETAARLETLEGEVENLEKELERVRGLQQQQEKDKLALDHEMRKLAEDLARANVRLSVARLELERLEREREVADRQRTEKRQALEALEEARRGQEEAAAAARAELERLKAEAGRVSEEHAALRAEVAGLEERRRAAEAALASQQAKTAELAARRRELSADLDRLATERARLAADNLNLQSQIALLAEGMAAAHREIERLVREETRLRAELAAREEALRDSRAQIEEAQERRAQIQIQLAERQAELKFLDETSRKDLGAAVADLVAEAEEAPLDEEALALADQRCQEIRARMEALGPVNPQALEEYHEAQQRYDFLNTQRQDLLDSIRDTEKVIREIDTESRKRFNEAFAAINVHFRELFAALFGGGTGEMRLTDEENAADSGIEIVASPPGKRLQNVLLLSGGEKALTALALLMAIFKYQPSPFCILDEVDAPLDEPNIQRFLRLLTEMAAQTQFILITHARRTMEAAQTLYGVTMQEPGVSKLVSVRLDAAPAPPAPQAATVPELARA